MAGRRNNKKLRDAIAAYDEDALILPGHDNAIIGAATGCGAPNRIIYDPSIIIQNLIKDGMSQEDAEEWFSFNIAGSYVGDGTPIFLTRFDPANDYCPV